MPATFDPREAWEVSTGKDSFTLNGKQAQLIKDASTAGQRGLVFFDGFAISIPHIISMKRTVSGSDAEEKEKRKKSIQNMIEQLKTS